MFPSYVRVTDEVKPRREYSIVESTYDPEVHTLLADKAATRPDGTPLPVKYTPADLVAESGGEGYAGLGVKALRDEIDSRNADRDPDGDAYLSKAGKKGELVARLEDDDDAQLLAEPDPLPEVDPEGDVDTSAGEGDD